MPKPKCPYPNCRREMERSIDASTLIRDVYICFNEAHPLIRVEKRSAFSWCMKGAKFAFVLGFTGFPDASDLPEFLKDIGDFFD